MKLLVMKFSPIYCHFIYLWSKYSPQILYLSILLHLKNSLIIKQLTSVLRATNLLFLFCSLVTCTQHVLAIISHH
jgi:hypothetical protein